LTLQGIDVIAIAVMIAGGFAACYVLLTRKLHMFVMDRQMKTAEQLGKLDDAIRALETRLAERILQPTETGRPRKATSIEISAMAKDTENSEDRSERGSEVAPEIHAAIAAAAVAAVGPNAVVNSVKAVPSPWTQQGRVLVQGGHNLRVQR